MQGMPIPEEVQKNIDALRKLQLEQQAPDYTTVQGQIDALKQMGEQWREEHKELKKKGKEEVEVVHRVPARSITYMLQKVIRFSVLGSTHQELEKAPLVYYNADEGIYIKDDRDIIKFILAIDDHTNKRARKEVLEWLRYEARARQVEARPYLVAVGNGYVDTRNGELHPFSPDKVFTSKVATNYVQDATEPEFNGWTFSGWIKELASGDHDKETLIWQLIASVVQSRRAGSVMFCLVDNGQGRTGKSTFEQLIANLVGEGNFTALKLNQFDDDFLVAQAYGAGVIIGDDNNPRGYIDDGSNLKSIVTNETIMINPKGLSPFAAKFYTTVIQSMNGVPRFRDVSGGMFRRFRMINFPKQYPATAANAKIKDEYIKEQRLLEWILKTALTINIDTIVDTSESRHIVHETKLDNDPVAYFVENYLPELKSSRIPVKFLFNYFMAAMDAENNHQRMKQNTFTRTIKPILEASGWTYSRKNLAPLDYFNPDDLKLVKGQDKGNGTAYGYLVEVDTHKKQPLFENTDN